MSKLWDDLDQRINLSKLASLSFCLQIDVNASFCRKNDILQLKYLKNAAFFSKNCQIYLT